VPGEIRRGVGHIGRVVIPRFHNARIAFAIIEIPAKKFPGKAGAFKLVQGCRLGLCPPIYSGWHFIPLAKPIVSRVYGKPFFRFPGYVEDGRSS
jgi:hypothetical protein